MLSRVELNDAFMNAMAEICAPLPGAVSLLNALQGKVRRASSPTVLPRCSRLVWNAQVYAITLIY
ncbi:5'-nucleotidase [Klebsiella aerogenes]|nr:5'-nucleotidase [Klebsiella aerogenes]